ncbi:MAG: FecR domain-containing protein [Pseudobacter sp.]|uniref:FecR domain-containing protein n=1 Tax=Pseudobacter sp. TaxID=2045420 RepID=UPI003F7FF384
MQQLPVDKELLRLYMDGKCSKEQLAVVREFLTNPAYRQSLEEWLKMDWQDVSSQHYDEEEKSPEIFRQFLSIVQPAVEQTPVKRIVSRRWWQVAAAAVFIGALGFIGWHWKQEEQNKQLALLENKIVRVHNEAGKRTMILLPDSSQVYLNAASSLQYNKNFGKTNRNVALEGEAFFIVKHGKEFPFSVRSGSITTVDIGTAFNIRYRNSDPIVKVAVAEGAVNVQSGGTIVSLLTQKQQLSYHTATRKATVQQLPDAATIGGWKDGILSFHKQSLQEVAGELERFYDIHIRFADPATADLLITTSIHKASVREALEIIALTAGVQIHQSTNEVLIK